jgi:alpha-ketoglutarate-dependent taurine dioxygenase
MQQNALTIPANILDQQIIRPARTGAVFSFHSSGALHMRYSARLRNIEWQADEDIQAAVQFIQTLWRQENSEYILRYTLQAGEGLICNNVLHRRTAFTDSADATQKRLLYRGRYYDRLI